MCHHKQMSVTRMYLVYENVAKDIDVAVIALALPLHKPRQEGHVKVDKVTESREEARNEVRGQANLLQHATWKDLCGANKPVLSYLMITT